LKRQIALGLLGAVILATAINQIEKSKIPTAYPQLIYGTWTIYDGADQEGTNWSQSLLRFTSQKEEPGGLFFRGEATWLRNGVKAGTEKFEGHYISRTRRVIFESTSVLGPDLAEGSYSATLSDDELKLVDGRWGTKREAEEGMQVEAAVGHWAATR
jgi:hypothetical protein